MGYQLWFPQVIVDAGLRLSTEPGWEKRGSVNFAPKCVVAHHTGVIPDVTRLLRDGHSNLSGPLCNIELRRSGECRVIAAGRANHAGIGGFRGLAGNSMALGIEASSDGKSWTDEQRRVYPILCAALAKGIGVGPEWIIRHKDWAPTRKWDAGSWTTEHLKAGQIKEEEDMTDHQAQLLTDLHEGFARERDETRATLGKIETRQSQLKARDDLIIAVLEKLYPDEVAAVRAVK